MNYKQQPLLVSLHGAVPQPSAAVRAQLCTQLMSALDQYYVHLPQKRAALATDPVRELQLLRASNGTHFTRTLLRIIARLRDRHTTLKFSEPFRSLIAFVPFTVERFFERGAPRYVLTRQLMGWEELAVGAEITHWNGTPIERFVHELTADNQGANIAARLQLAVANLTIRPLAFMLMPTEDWVTLNYVTVDGRSGALTVAWRFLSNAPEQVSSAAMNDNRALAGVDELTLITNRFRRSFQGLPGLTSPSRPPDQPASGGDGAGSSSTSSLQSEMQGQLRFGKIGSNGRESGYVRLTTFEVPDARAFVHRMAEILSGLPQDRLIIDLRSNPGGLITAGQKFVQLLTRRPIAPSPVAFRNTASTLALGNLPMFQPWARSLGIQWFTGELFSQALPLTTFEDMPDYRYPGKTVLIIDGLCYSTTDFFAADFKDNDVGTIIGVDDSTGGGGANVWGWSLLAELLGSAGPGPLPAGYELNIAMRRSLRTGMSGGIPVEDLGVPADVLYFMTRNDVLSGNRDLLAFANELLQRA